MVIESEKVIERELQAEVKKLGGWALKMLPGQVSGLPDRLILLPGGRLFFAEVKTTKQKPRKIQIYIHNKLKELGFRAEVIDSSNQIYKILKSYESNS